MYLAYVWPWVHEALTGKIGKKMGIVTLFRFLFYLSYLFSFVSTSQYRFDGILHLPTSMQTQVCLCVLAPLVQPLV